MNNKKIKSLVLFSGGLDSILAVLILREQGIEVKGVCFKSCFFDCKKAKIEAKKINLKLYIIEEHLNLIKNPPHGYGKHLNPCIDCHALMIKRAGELAQEKGYNFVATGEVLGQRPFSQNKIALKKVKELAGFDVLRPLSAKLLPETEVEKKRLVDRDKLLDIRGRNRQKQQELIKKYNIIDYPSPAGGCLLTDPSFSNRLKKMFEFWPDCTKDDIELLKYGRVFWLIIKDNLRVLVMVGRDKKDNDNLEKISKKGDFVLKLKETTGPTTLLRFPKELIDNTFYKNKVIEVFVPEKLDIDTSKPKDVEQLFYTAAILTAFYAPKMRGQKTKIEISRK